MEPTGNSLQDGDEEISICGEDIWANEEKDIECATLYVSRMPTTLKKHTHTQQKTNDCQPQPKTKPEDRKNLWVNMSQEEELRPYSELPWGDLDSQVTEVIKNLSFKQDEIEQSVRQNGMGLYIMLDTTKTKKRGHTSGQDPAPPLTPTAVLSQAKKFCHHGLIP